MQHDLVYKKMLGRLRTHAPEILYVDLYTGQLEEEDPEKFTFPTPCTFIEFLPGETMSTGNRTQGQLLEILVYVAGVVPQEVNSTESETVREAGLDHSNRVREVADALVGFNSGDDEDVAFSSMTRSNVDSFNIAGILTAHIITLRTYLTDRSITTRTIAPESPPDIVVEV